VHFLRAVLFEQPLYLIPILVIVLFVLVRVWARRRTARTARAVWIGLAVAVLLLVMQALVVTHRERIVLVCRAMATAVQDGDVPAIASHVADGFEAEGYDKTAFVSRLKQTLTRVHVEDAKLGGFEVTVEGGRTARAVFTASARLILPDSVTYRSASRWDVHFERISGVWRMVSVKPISTPTFPFDHLRDVLR
jgi:hypothetical protein